MTSQIQKLEDELAAAYSAGAGYIVRCVRAEADRDKLAARIRELEAQLAAQSPTEVWRRAMEAAAQPLTDAEAHSAALSYRHDFGLLPAPVQQAFAANAKWWHVALSHRIRALPLPDDLR